MTARKGIKPKGKHPVTLSNEFVRDIPTPQKDHETFWDDKAVGFGVRVYASGARSFFVNYTLDGRERRHTIGAFPAWSASAGRARAKELRKKIDQGHDPAGEKRERREAATVQDLIDRYIEEHLPKKTGGPKRVSDEKRMLGLIGAALGKHEKVAAIHGGDIAEMHRKVTESRGPIRANRVLACASKMFALACVPLAGESRPWRDAAQGNPCKGIERNHEESRERFYSQAELVRIAEALAEYPPDAHERLKKPGEASADCVRLIMLTGCRPAEGMKAEWSEFDADGVWTKPSAHTKQKKKHRVPLAPPAIQLIEKLRKHRTSEKWVFPGKRPGEPLTTLVHVWRYVRRRAQLADDENGNKARIYDLRHTFASVGVGGGLQLQVIGKLLGHTQARTTQRYAHVADDPLREAAHKIGSVIAGAGEDGADVVAFPKRGPSA